MYGGAWQWLKCLSGDCSDVGQPEFHLLGAARPAASGCLMWKEHWKWWLPPGHPPFLFPTHMGWIPCPTVECGCSGCRRSPGQALGVPAG